MLDNIFSILTDDKYSYRIFTVVNIQVYNVYFLYIHEVLVIFKYVKFKRILFNYQDIEWCFHFPITAWILSEIGIETDTLSRDATA